jgi:8-oxo-dGTP pyrophosphatase MutT (NUDIX family)
VRRFATDSGQFNLRIAGVCIHDGHLLLHHDDGDGDFWVLPGGRPLLGEPSPDALRREMAEEIGVDVTVDRLLWVVENFFAWRGKRLHEVAFYYVMHLPADALNRDIHAEFTGYEGQIPLRFRWFPLATLERIRLYPRFLPAALADLPQSPRHIIHWDE